METGPKTRPRGPDGPPARPLHADRDGPAAVAEARVDDLAPGRAEGEVETDGERVVVARGELPLAEKDVLQGGAPGREGQLVPDPGVAPADLEAQAPPDTELELGLELEPVELDVVEEMGAGELHGGFAPRLDDLVGEAQGLLKEGLGGLEVDRLLVVAGPGQA